MIFRQLFEASSSSYTYLIGCPSSKLAILIDPVLETVARDLALIDELGLTLHATLETHVHADHLTGARKLKHLSGCQIAGPAMDKLPCRDIQLDAGQTYTWGQLQLHCLHVPGHTDSHFAYYLPGEPGMIFSGDSLMIDGCGRTDFQAGNAAELYQSVHQRIYTLPDDTLLYPGHDYQGRHVSSIQQEKQRNPRLKLGISQGQFESIMAELKLPQPSKIQFAVPGNEQCGKCPDDVPAEFKGPCETNQQG